MFSGVPKFQRESYDLRKIRKLLHANSSKLRPPTPRAYNHHRWTKVQTRVRTYTYEKYSHYNAKERKKKKTRRYTPPLTIEVRDVGGAIKTNKFSGFYYQGVAVVITRHYPRGSFSLLKQRNCTK